MRQHVIIFAVACHSVYNNSLHLFFDGCNMWKSLSSYLCCEVARCNAGQSVRWVELTTGWIHGESKSCVLTALLHGIYLWASAKLCGAEQRAPPVFGRATMRLGIGPHSSCIILCDCNVLCCLYCSKDIELLTDEIALPPDRPLCGFYNEHCPVDTSGNFSRHSQVFFLQCFDAVGWAAGRACGL